MKLKQIALLNLLLVSGYVAAPPPKCPTTKAAMALGFLKAGTGAEVCSFVVAADNNLPIAINVDQDVFPNGVDFNITQFYGNNPQKPRTSAVRTRRSTHIVINGQTVGDHFLDGKGNPQQRLVPFQIRPDMVKLHIMPIVAGSTQLHQKDVFNHTEITDYQNNGWIEAMDANDNDLDIHCERANWK